MDVQSPKGRFQLKGFGVDTTLFKGDTMTYYGRWTYKFEEAARTRLATMESRLGIQSQTRAIRGTSQLTCHA